MAAPKSLINYLDKGGIKYEVVSHKKVYTAYDLAQTLGEKLDTVAKTVLVKVELPKVDKRGKYFVLVLPASYKVNFNKLKKELKAKKASLVSEKDLKKLKVKPGAITPFGTYHKLGTLIDKALMKTSKALVSAGSHTDSLRVQVKELHIKEGAVIGAFADKTKLKLQKSIKKAKKVVKKGRGVAKIAKKAVKKASKAKSKKAVKKIAKRAARKIVKKVAKKKPATKKRALDRDREKPAKKKVVVKKKPTKKTAKKKPASKKKATPKKKVVKRKVARKKR